MDRLVEVEGGDFEPDMGVSETKGYLILGVLLIRILLFRVLY